MVKLEDVWECLQVSCRMHQPSVNSRSCISSGNLQTQRHSAKQSVTHAHGLFYSFLVTHSVYLVPYKLPFKRATSTSVSFYYLFSLILFKIKEQQENPAHCKLHVIHLYSIIAYVMVDTSCQLDRLRRLTKRLNRVPVSQQGAGIFTW